MCCALAGESVNLVERDEERSKSNLGRYLVQFKLRSCCKARALYIFEDGDNCKENTLSKIGEYY